MCYTQNGVGQSLKDFSCMNIVANLSKLSK